MLLVLVSVLSAWDSKSKASLGLIGLVGAMGNASNPNAVVDTNGRVRGVSSLRVVDASTFPLLPPGHCQATVCTYSHDSILKVLPDH